MSFYMESKPTYFNLKVSDVSEENWIWHFEKRAAEWNETSHEQRPDGPFSSLLIWMVQRLLSGFCTASEKDDKYEVSTGMKLLQKIY